MKKETTDRLQLHFNHPMKKIYTKCEILQVDELTNFETSKQQCHNPSLGHATKARACKGAGQK